MKIKVNGIERELSIIGKNGIDWVEDFVNAPVYYNQETGQFEMDDEVYQYWGFEIQLQKKIDGLIDALTPEHEDEINEIIRYIGDGIDRDALLSGLELLNDQVQIEARATQAADAVRINIKAAREAAGISQADLAVMIGTTRQQIGKYETGEQDMTVARLFQIAAALGITPDTLVKN